MDRYYKDMTTRKRALILGAIVEEPGFFVLTLLLAATLFSLPIGLYLFILTPVLLLTGALIMWLRPVPNLCRRGTELDLSERKWPMEVSLSLVRPLPDGRSYCGPITVHTLLATVPVCFVFHDPTSAPCHGPETLRCCVG